MSASAVLNLIAPSVPRPALAANDADPSAFGGLLSDALSGEASAGDMAALRPTTQPPSDVAKTATRTASTEDGDNGNLIDPTGTDMIQILPPAPMDAVVAAELPPVDLSVATSEADILLTEVTTKASDQPQVMPLPVVQTVGPPAAQTSVSSTSTLSASTPVLPGVVAADAADAALMAAASKAATDEVQTLPPANPGKTATTTPPVPQVQPPAPAPLKPASERTGRSTDSLTREGNDASASGEGVKVSTTAPTNAAVTPATANGKTTAEAAFAPATGPLSGDGDSNDLKADGAAASLDTAKAHAEATVAHDASLSTLSRATIDATAQIAAQIIRKLDGKSTRFELALTPDDLGRVDVKLEIDAEGRLAARLAFDNAAAAADLRGRADELRRQLQDAGFHVPDDAFEFAERDSGSSAFDRGSSDQNNERQSRAFTAASRLNAEIDVAQPPRWMSLSLSPSGVDLKV